MRTVLTVVLLSFATVCLAGSEKEFACRKCRLKGTYGTGGGLPSTNFPHSVGTRITSFPSRGPVKSIDPSQSDQMPVCLFSYVDRAGIFPSGSPALQPGNRFVSAHLGS